MVGTQSSPNPSSLLYLDGAGNLYSTSENPTVISSVNYHYTFSNLCKWNGTTWSNIGSLNANASISTMCADASGNLYVAGQFTDTMFLSTYWCHPSGSNYIAKWDGVAWSILGGRGALSGVSFGYVTSLVFNPSNGYIYASIIKSYNPVFAYDIYFWNGSTWAILDNSTAKLNRSSIPLLVDNNGNLYTAGTFTNSSGKYYVAMWNGTNWIELGTGANALNANGNIYSLCNDAAGNIYAAGDFTNSSGKYYVAKWHGTSWTELGGVNGLNANGSLRSLCMDGTGNIYVTGYCSYQVSTLDRSYYVAKWDGNYWSVLGKNTLFANGNISNISVNSGGTIFAIGNFTNSSNNCYVGHYP